MGTGTEYEVTIIVLVDYLAGQIIADEITDESPRDPDRGVQRKR